MRLTMRQLQYIVAVADAGRFGAAAKNLNVAQPSLSAQIAEVETEIGLRIFDRGRNGARTTSLGADVVRRARSILRETEDLLAVAKGRQPFDGHLRLGVLPSVGPFLLPNVVRQLHLDHPNLRLVLKDESTSALEDGLRSGELDFVISTAQDHSNTFQTPLFRERFFAAFALDDPLAQTKRELVKDDLKSRTLLTLDRSHRLSLTVHDLANESGAMVSLDYNGSSLDTIRLMAATGAGIAILPELYTLSVAAKGQDIALRPLTFKTVHRELSLIQIKRDELIPGGDILAKALSKEANTLLGEATQ